MLLDALTVAVRGQSAVPKYRQGTTTVKTPSPLATEDALSDPLQGRFFSQ